jgi:hypothetical protein
MWRLMLQSFYNGGFWRTLTPRCTTTHTAEFLAAECLSEARRENLSEARRDFRQPE